MKPAGRIARACGLVVALGCGALVATTVPAATVPPAAATPAPALPWFDGDRPGPQARQAVALLAHADDEGLEPADYDAAGLQRAVDAAAAGVPDAAARAQLEQRLTAAMLRLLTDVNRGRIDPRTVHVKFSLPPSSFDASSALRDALAARNLELALRAAAPPLKVYADLRAALATYRALGAHPAWTAPLPRLPGGANGKVEPGQSWDGLPLVARRLQALGDLAADAPASDRLDGPLAEAVRAFQRRHGLIDDGVVGRATRAALEVPPAQRAQQIALTMERLRWTPLARGPRMIVINVPEFVLRAYEVRGERFDVQLEMKVIVGRALQTRTPLISEDLAYIEFSPYWNVPRSIATEETVPRLQRDPAYWTREGFEFVGRDGRVDTALSAAQLEAVLRGEARIRQRPGPANALGDIKFVFPNNDAIYLHHTPSVGLFARERRDFSHGCIRIEDPVALAKFVLRAQPEWTEERIRAAMAEGTSRTLRVAQPVPVLVAYGTALVRQGRPHFFVDLYGHDRLLAQALRARTASRVIRAPATAPPPAAR
jgi:murein L,D-transpeptidase YcbB/YkuD